MPARETRKTHDGRQKARRPRPTDVRSAIGQCAAQGAQYEQAFKESGRARRRWISEHLRVSFPAMGLHFHPFAESHPTLLWQLPRSNGLRPTADRLVRQSALCPRSWRRSTRALRRTHPRPPLSSRSFYQRGKLSSRILARQPVSYLQLFASALFECAVPGWLRAKRSTRIGACTAPEFSDAGARPIAWAPCRGTTRRAKLQAS